MRLANDIAALHDSYRANRDHYMRYATPRTNWQEANTHIVSFATDNLGLTDDMAQRERGRILVAAAQECAELAEEHYWKKCG